MSVKLTFLGAANTVTGSRTLLSFHRRKWLIDCGLFQGAKQLRELNWACFTPDPKEIEHVILTHAHLDHSGYLPRFCRQGFRGKILATDGTADLCGILLRDAAHLEEEAARYANETGYSNHKPAKPLFTVEDADLAISKLQRYSRRQWVDLGSGLSLRFLRAGHIIGASLVQMSIGIEGAQKVVTFTGDLGNGRSFVMRGPDQLTETDVLVLESTYGDRIQPRSSSLEILGGIIRRTAQRKGVLVIPAFAVGRAQELIYMLRLLEDRGMIPRIPVILDSPMAAAAMAVCLRRTEDQVFESAFHGSNDPFLPEKFEIAASVDESMLACMRSGPMIVISASGMLNGGRVLHHLKRRLPDEKNTLLFTGHQAVGTKGRYLQELGAQQGKVRIHHAEIGVKAEIITMEHLSSHADQLDIISYLERMRKLPTRIFINHGEPEAQRALAAKIESSFGINAQPVADHPEIELFCT